MALKRIATQLEWESLEAKLALDAAERELVTALAVQPEKATPRSLRPRERDAILRLSEDARVAARHAGSLRREFGAVVHASLVLPADEALSMLLAMYRVVRTEWQHDLNAEWGLIFGMIAALIDKTPAPDTLPSPAVVATQLTDLYGLPAQPPTTIARNIAQYWGQYDKRAEDYLYAIATGSVI